MKIPAMKPVTIVIFEAVPASDPAESMDSASCTDAAWRGIIVDFKILSGMVFPFESLNCPKLN